MEGNSSHLSRLTTCVTTDTEEPEYESRIVREHLDSSYSRLVIPFEAGIAHCKQHVLARTFANRIRDHYVGLGLTTIEETPSMCFRIMRGPRGGGFVAFRLPRDVHIIPEGLSSLGRMRLANTAYVPGSKNSMGDCARPSFTSTSSPCFIKSPCEELRPARNLVGIESSDEGANPKALSKVSTKPDSSSILWRRRKGSKSKRPKPEKQKRSSDNRILGLSECEDSDDDFILYLDLHNASLSEIATQLSRLVQGRLPSNQQALEQDVYKHLYRITETPGTAADAEQRVDRMMAQAQIDETWHFYLRQAVQNSDATSQIGNLPDDPKARAKARKIARAAAAHERQSARLYEEKSRGGNSSRFTVLAAAARGHLQALCESEYVYQRVYSPGPERELQIKTERKHLLDGLKKYWHLPIEDRPRENSETAGSSLAEAGTEKAAVEESGMSELGLAETATQTNAAEEDGVIVISAERINEMETPKEESPAARSAVETDGGLTAPSSLAQHFNPDRPEPTRRVLDRGPF